MYSISCRGLHLATVGGDREEDRLPVVWRKERPDLLVSEAPHPTCWERGVFVPPPGYAAPLSVGFACSEAACFFLHFS